MPRRTLALCSALAAATIGCGADAGDPSEIDVEFRSETFIVSNTNDAGRDPMAPECKCFSVGMSPCSLRAAIQTANLCPGHDTIELDAPGTYPLDEVGTDDNAVAGDLDITEGVTIYSTTGTGQQAPTIDASLVTDRVFDVHEGADFVLMSGFKIMKGLVPTSMGFTRGGCLRIRSSSVRLSTMVVGGDPSKQEGCQAWGGGGISAADSELTVVSTKVVGNATLNVSLDQSPGGGIYATDSDVRIDESDVLYNNAEIGGGLMVSNNGASGRSLEVGSSTISRNDAVSGGGGAHLSTPLSIQDSTISFNENFDQTSLGGGGLYVAPIFPDPGVENTVVDTAIIANRSGRGGGVTLTGVLTLRRTQVERNRAFATVLTSGNGGGVYSSQDALLRLIESSVTVNRSVSGGGVYIQGTGRLENSTIVGNMASVEGGGVFADEGAAVDALHVTIRGNVATGGGGGIYDFNSDTRLDRTALFGNTPDECVGAVVSAGAVVTDLASCVFPSSLIIPGTATGWGPLLFHPPTPPMTKTISICQPNSAIEAAEPCGVVTDQRGVPRNPDVCDVGAYEQQDPSQPC